MLLITSKMQLSHQIKPEKNLPVNLALPYKSCICGANPNLNRNKLGK